MVQNALDADYAADDIFNCLENFIMKKMQIEKKWPKLFYICMNGH